MIKQLHIRWEIVGLGALLVSLWLVPVWVGVPHPFGNHAVRSLGIVEYIGRTGNIWSNEVAYLAWFGAFLPMGLLKMMFSINFEPLINYVPFLLHI